MDWLTFFAKLADALAWPAVIGFGLLRFGPGIATLIGRLTHLKFPGAEASFSKELDKAESAVSALSVPEQPKQTSREALVTQTEAELPPAYVVQQAWLRIELALRDAAQKRGLFAGKRHVTVEQMAQSLSLSDDDRSLIRQLRELRNLAVHAKVPNLSSTDALRYSDFADAIIRTINEGYRVGDPE